MGGGYNLEQLGIQCLLNETGYICLGKSYGNACIQFGIADGERYTDKTLPLSASKILMTVATDCNNSTDVNDIYSPIISIMRYFSKNNKIRFVCGKYNTNSTNAATTNLGVIYWLAITLP